MTGTTDVTGLSTRRSAYACGSVSVETRTGSFDGPSRVRPAAVPRQLYLAATIGQRPSAKGRKASAAGIVCTTL